MKKALVLFSTLLLLLTACSNTTERPINLDTFASEILSSEAFSEQLRGVDTELGCQYYSLKESDFKKAMFYFSSGATAEELVLFEATDTAAVSRIKEAVTKRMDYQSISFKNYVPSEVPKIEDAVVYTRGNYVIIYVASDYDAAKAVLDNY